MKRPRPAWVADGEEARRRPSLADRFIHRQFSAHERVIHPRTVDQLKRSVRDAHRFVLTEDAVRRIGEVIVDIPDLLFREHQFARAPYDKTWIEFPSHILWNIFRNRHPENYTGSVHDQHGGRFFDPETADHTLGYLIDHERVTVVCGGTVEDPDAACQITPIQYRLHTLWPKAEAQEFARLTNLHGSQKYGAYPLLLAFMWGSTLAEVKDFEVLKPSSGRNVAEFLPFNPLHHNWDKFRQDAAWVDALRGSVGELRNIIALLLMMNRPSLTRYLHTNAAGRRFYKGKLMPYMSHTTVTIDIDARPTLRLLGTPAGDAVPRRRHEVKGHYKHDQTARDYSRIAGCIHEYAPAHGPEDGWAPWPDAPLGVPGEPGCPRNWVCGVCGGRRWWQRDHGRGTAEQGFVVHDAYEVGADTHGRA